MEALDTWFRQRKVNWRLAAALRAPRADDAATPDELDRLVNAQLAPWLGRSPLGAAQACQALADVQQQRLSVWRVSIRGRGVRVWPRTPPSAEQLNHPTVRAHWDAFRWRVLFYRALFAAVAARSPRPLSLDFALDLADDPIEHPDVPILGFQKPAGASTVLVPDVDFFHLRWYGQAQDPWRYEDKTPTACFVGASTGGAMDERTVREDLAPRLRAARHFHGSDRVQFRIARAAQCTSDAVRQALEAKPYFGATVPWSEQLRHRFLISIDGNGAACSRLVQSLMSHSAVIQYVSPHQLYYFSALRPGEHLLRVQDDAEVDAIVRDEQSQPGRHRAVAEGGAAFARKYLRAHSVVDYTVRLMAAIVPWTPALPDAA